MVLGQGARNSQATRRVVRDRLAWRSRATRDATATRMASLSLDALIFAAVAVCGQLALLAMMRSSVGEGPLGRQQRLLGSCLGRKSPPN